MECYINKIHCQNYFKLFLALSNRIKEMIWMPNHTKHSVVNRATAFLLICRTSYKLPGANIKINKSNLHLIGK